MDEKKKGNAGLIICIVILLLICVGMGTYIFINKDKLIAKEKAETTVKNDDKDVVEEVSEKTVDAEETTDIDDSKYTDSVYGLNGSTIVLFKTGKCVMADTSHYTAHCRYYIEDKIVNITRTSLAPGNGTEVEDMYTMTTDNNGIEYIESSTNKDLKYKLLKEYS